MIEAYDAGDPSLLADSGSDLSATASPAQDSGAATGSADSNGSTPAAAATTAAAADGSPRGRDGLTGAEREAVRAWAVEQGIDVKTRGQLKKDLVANYQAWQARQR